MLLARFLPASLLPRVFLALLCRGLILALARGNPHDMHCVADRVGRSFLAFWFSGHVYRLCPTIKASSSAISDLTCLIDWDAVLHKTLLPLPIFPGSSISSARATRLTSRSSEDHSGLLRQ
jgi:hypothetical protein